jgi:hypothetical protein
MRPPASNWKLAPASASRQGSDATGPGRRTSITQKLPGSRVERCNSNLWPFRVLAASAAFTVPLVLTTRRSPGDSHRGNSLNRA